MILRILMVAGLAYLALVVLVFLLQSRLLHLPDVPGRELIASPADIGLDYDVVQFRADDGVALHGWWVPARQPRATLLFFHGNAGNISHRLDSLAIFHELDLNVLLFDYRGYGRSEGRPDEHGLYLDAEAARACVLNACGVAHGDVPLVYFGRSLGGAVAAKLAVLEPPRALIVESAFISVPEIAAEVYPFLPARPLARMSYDTRAAVAEVSSPLLVIHSRDDEIIPFDHGQAIAAAAGGPARLLEIRGDHNTGFLSSGRLYRQGLADFLDDVL